MRIRLWPFPQLTVCALLVACSAPPEPEPSARTLDEVARKVSRHELTTERRLDGTEMLALDGTHLQARVVRQRADGTLEHGCVGSPEALRRWLGENPSPARSGR